MSEETGRGTGRTTRQMENAPNEAIFIWCNQHLDYPKRLARELGREDLQIYSPGVLSDAHRFAGMEISGVVIDHAMPPPTDSQMQGIDWLNAWMGRKKADA